DGEIELAKDTPPQTTRAKLRGDFIAAAQAAQRDFTVDWVHLKLNDQAQRTVLCKDPFRHVDERVQRLIASLRGQPPAIGRRRAGASTGCAARGARPRSAATGSAPRTGHGR